MAAMSLGFIVMVTPWTIQEVVAACTGSKPPPFLDFLATWLALSNSFWNPFLYWLLNNHFRRISRELLYTKGRIVAHQHSRGRIDLILCRSKPLGAKQHCCATSTGGLDVCSIAGVDLSGTLNKCHVALRVHSSNRKNLSALNFLRTDTRNIYFRQILKLTAHSHVEVLLHANKVSFIN
ncbi:hypothetical protein X777_12829 [Ooceraea biroi]|uniref:G-protein coupled receptors family 1 profile domain-containing protein n=1 Tax=Ooceraea biroi TaxID=2015173 RepID=A0A026VZB5_OOCBI|nr:hypothetical protein X777_12829 [Ooceraea biroi]